MKEKSYEDLEKKIVKSSDVKEGDYIYPHDTSETKAKWKNERYESNLEHSFYKVLKVNPKSLRVMDLLSCRIATVNKEKWRGYEYPEHKREVDFTKILDKDEIDKQLSHRGFKKCDLK